MGVGLFPFFQSLEGPPISIPYVTGIALRFYARTLLVATFGVAARSWKTLS